MASRKAIVKWLLEGDPAIRWQVQRDLVGAPEHEVATERARVAEEGWGARLLALQAPGGHWGPPDDEGWMTTMKALVLLKDLGADPQSAPVRAAIARVRDHITWHQLDGRPFFDGETEACINGRILAAGAWFGEETGRLADRLLADQLEDGGWNCDAPPSTRASFHSTICVLEGLLAHENACGPAPAISAARRRGEAYLLDRHLCRRRSTGAVADRRWFRFAFPPTWHYDLLRALDYFRSAGAPPDPRMAEAVAVVEQRRHQNARWPLNTEHADRFDLPMEPGRGRASRWNTLRAMRVLDWYGAVAA